KPRSGFFAAEVERHPDDSPGVRLEITEYEAPLLSHFYHASQEEQVRYDFGYGSIDLNSFPLTKWRKLMNRCLLPENSHLLLYGDMQGELGLRTEIATYLHQIRGV